ncbi:MAG TPA: hypothetical protein VMY06_06895 [Sedimentisphaerales bacterium]|nr:hypothetical protein [Sedimentisphaerales bacterium]
MKPIIKDLKQIAGFLLVTIVASSVFAQDRLHCPKIRNSQRPALLFVEGSVDKQDLCVAYFDGQTAQNEKIVSAKHPLVTQLDNAVFLVCAKRSSTKGRVYAIDLRRGIANSLAESTRIHCLRSEPRMKKAMLVDANMGIGKVRLIELNLANLKVTLRHTLTKQLLGDGFDGIGPRMKLSPDFRHIVYASRKGDGIPELWSEYILRVLDLSTMKIENLDTNVGVQISAFSSIGRGRPPFEWVNNNKVIYQDMVPNEPNEISRPPSQALNVFKIVDVETKKISELLRREFPLTLDGGSLIANPLNGQLIYNNKWILDQRKKTFKPKDLPFSIVTNRPTKQMQVLSGRDVLYSGSARCVDCCVSPSGKNFAYSLRPKSRSLAEELYAKIQGLPEPIKVAEGPSWTRAIGWIE